MTAVVLGHLQKMANEPHKAKKGEEKKKKKSEKFKK